MRAILPGFVLAGLFCTLATTLVPTAHAISTKAERYTLIPEPPAVAVVDLDSYKVFDSIPLRAAPDHALPGPGNQFLYVLSHIIAKKGDPEGDRSEVTVIDIAAREVIKTISIPTRVSRFDLGVATLRRRSNGREDRAAVGLG